MPDSMNLARVTIPTAKRFKSLPARAGISKIIKTKKKRLKEP